MFTLKICTHPLNLISAMKITAEEDLKIAIISSKKLFRKKTIISRWIDLT